MCGRCVVSVWQVCDRCEGSYIRCGCGMVFGSYGRLATSLLFPPAPAVETDEGVPELFAHDAVEQEVDGGVDERQEVHEVAQLDVAVTVGGGKS